jgi:hypothetical protein
MQLQFADIVNALIEKYKEAKMKGNSSPQAGFTVKVENNVPYIKRRTTLSYMVALTKYRFNTFLKGSEAISYAKIPAK